MKKFLPVLLLLFISYNGFAQLEVGKSQNQLESEKPKRIGAKMALLNPEYELWAIDKDGQHTEYLRYEASGTNSYYDIKFSSMKEEKDFYEYVLGLFDNFKDNEILLKNYKLVPNKMSLVSKGNLFFDVYLFKNSSGHNESVMISKKAWIKLFKDSKINSL